MNKEEVQKLAKLSRVSISDTEAESLSHEFESILTYVGEIKNAGTIFDPKEESNLHLKNVLREDANPHDSGLYTESLLREMPSKEGQYLKVKKIL